MVTVAKQHGSQFLLPLVGKKVTEIERVLIHVPHVERLVDDNHAQLVTRVQKACGLRIVRQAQGVVSVLLMNEHLP